MTKVLKIHASDVEAGRDPYESMLIARRKAREVFQTYDPKPERVEVLGFTFDETLVVPNIGKVFRAWEREVLQ